MIRTPAIASLVVLLFLAVAGTTAPLSAQNRPSSGSVDEDRLLQEASILEARGDHQGAEDRLRTILRANPANASAIFTLDRILANQDRREEMIPLVEDHLEARPESPAVRGIHMRLMARHGDADAFRGAVEEWIESQPESLDPFAESVGYWEDHFGPEQALVFIEEGRERSGIDDALAARAGLYHARLDQPQQAVEEWRTALEGGGSLSNVFQAIRDLPGESRELMELLVEDLARGGTAADQLRSASRLALDAGLEEGAIALARRAVEAVDDRAARGYLIQFANRADELEMAGAALWAFERVRTVSTTEVEIVSLDARIAELSLIVGDTARALEAWNEVHASFPEGSVQRRRSIASSLGVELAYLPLDGAVDRLEEFRAEFPDAPELDGFSARLADRLVRAGEPDRAAEIVAGVEGPGTGLFRAYARLRSGEVDRAVASLQEAIPSLAPAEATDVLRLVNFLQGAGDEAAELGGRMAALAQEGRIGGALALLDDEVDRISLDDRPGLLSLGAHLAEEQGEAAEAAELRQRIVSEFPDSPEMPEAAIQLARYRWEVEGRTEDARLILEELILGRPDSAVIPEARRALQRLRSAVPGGAGR